MNIFPAIDLMDGKAVRLFKGDKTRVTCYGDPVEIAMNYSEYTENLHIIDLDGAFNGEPVNYSVMEKIVNTTGMKVQVGGGFRDYESVKRAYDYGASNVIIGTKAFDFGFLEKITSEFEGITISLDIKNGKIMTGGWLKSENLDLQKIFTAFTDYTDRFIYTDVEKDGTLEGATYVENFWKGSRMIYAAGVTTVDDINRLKSNGFYGVIIGKALLDGKISLKELAGK